MDPALFKDWALGAAIGTAIAIVIAVLFLKARPSADGRSFSIRVGSLWPGAAMVGVCAVAVWAAMMGWPRWPGVAGEQRLAWVYILVTILAVFAGLLQRSFAVRAGLAALSAAFAAAFVLYSPSAGLGALSDKLLVIAASAAGMLLAAGSLAALEWRGRRISATVILTGLALAAGAAMALSSSLKLGQFAWAVVPAGLVAVAVCSLRKGATLGSAAMVCAACIVGATLVAGFRFSDLKPVSAVIFALCPLLALIADAVLTPMLKPRMAALAVILAAAIPAAVAIAISARL